MQKYFGTRIADVLPRINHDILIPSIQRPYVWEADQILKLFDSLMQGYPINTFLFWELVPEHIGDWEVYRFVRDFRQGDVHNDPAVVPSDKPVTLVLDGQQRLTSLLIGLTGTYTVRNGSRGRGAGWVQKVLLLNLVQSPDVSTEDEDETVTRELYYDFKFVNVDRMPKNDKEAVWFKVSGIVGISDRDQLAATIDKLLMLNPDLPDDAQRQLKLNLTRLWQVVHEEECVAYYLERDQSADKVLDIFIRANDGGTRLSRSDLLMSMVMLRWQQYNARTESEAVTYAMRDALQQETAFDRDYLLRSGLFFNDLDFAFQLRNFTPRNIGLIESRWASVKRALLLASELFRRFGITGGALTGQNAVMLIACYLFKAKEGQPEEAWTVSDEDQQRIRRWITAVLFHGVLGGAANITMEFYRRVLNEQLKLRSSFPMAELTARMTIRGRNMHFDDEAIGRFAAQETKSRIFAVSLCLLYPRSDWTAKNWQVVPVIPKEHLLDDRLRVQGVPADEIAAYQSWANRLANHVVLDDDEARERFETGMEDWVATRTPEFFRRHLLPDNPALYDEYRFLDFIKARKQLIAQHLQPLLQEAVSEPEPPLQPSHQAARPQQRDLDDDPIEVAVAG